MRKFYGRSRRPGTSPAWLCPARISPTAAGVTTASAGIVPTVGRGRTADAYRLIAEQIGKSNAALIEVLKIVGERNIQIAPRVMVTGGGGPANSNSGTALIGTMLDTMMAKSEP